MSPTGVTEEIGERIRRRRHEDANATPDLHRHAHDFSQSPHITSGVLPTLVAYGACTGGLQHVSHLNSKWS